MKGWLSESLGSVGLYARKITPIKGYTTENLADLKLLQLSLHP